MSERSSSVKRYSDRGGVEEARERGVFPWQKDKGQPPAVELAIAMGYSSAMQHELIQQLNDALSVDMDVARAASVCIILASARQITPNDARPIVQRGWTCMTRLK